ncbi:MAG: hypothetical protein AABO41_27305 [Acidobacteriota bacterium]
MATGAVALDNAAVFCGEPVSGNKGSSAASNVGETELLEIRLARARLDQAERHMNSLKTRIDYLERRAASSIGATERELEDLMRARDELSASAANVAHLSLRLERPEVEESETFAEWDGWNDY